MTSFAICAIFLSCLLGIKAATIDQALIWTEKSLDGVVRIRGLRGNPQHWIDHGIPDYVTYGTPSTRAVQYKSVRTALGFRYSSRELLFSDVGYREIFKMPLADAYISEHPANATVTPVYSGTSSRVRGVTVDWQAANVYWTDSSYNWITVAAIDRRDVYRHIVTTDLDIPVGIAVYPQKGLLFWTDQGVRPKIERSRLDGSGRYVIQDKNVYRPTSITIDYSEDQVFWIEDYLDTVFRMDLNGNNVRGFKVNDKDTSDFQYLYGIVVYQNFVFITDQFMMSIKIYDKNLEVTRGDIELKLSVPYDVMMYDSSIQEDFYKSDTFSKPEYIYSLGSRICSSHVRLASLDQDLHGNIVPDTACFADDVGYVEALTVDVRANLLFYSDTKSSTIRRVRLDDGNIIEDHLLQTGVVKGLSVDWINNNIYWTDDDNGQILVSKYDGTLIKVIVERLQHPQALVVDPINGFMYWSTIDAIYKAYLDGSNSQAFVSAGVHSPQGLTINYKDKRLYWVDNVVKGISRIRLNGTDQEKLYTDPDKTYRDITVYQGYLAWTDGAGGITFAQLEDDHLTHIKSIKNENDDTSSSIITFADFTQPMSSGATCHCTTGFHLDVDGRTCISAIKDRNFVIFADPLHRSFYQLDAMSLDPRPPLGGVLLLNSGSPTLIAYDIVERILYWYDRETHEIKRKVFQVENRAEYIVLKLTAGSHVGSMHIDQSNQILYYTDTIRKSINSISLMDITQVKTILTDALIPEAFTIDLNSGWMFWLSQRADSHFIIWRSRTSELPRKTVIINRLQQPDIRGLTVDSKDGRLYWWNKTTINSATISGTDQISYQKLPTTDIISVAAYAGHLYISDHSQRYLTKYNTLTAEADILTDPLFSRIESVRVFMSKFQQDPVPSLTPDTSRNGTGISTSVAPSAGGAEHLSSIDNKSTSVVLATGLSALVVVIIIVVVIVLVIRRRRRTKKPPSDPYDTDAHDNPTYMRADQVIQRSAQVTSPPPRPPGGDTITHAMTPDDATRPIPEVGVQDHIVLMTNTGDVIATAGDRAALVRNMADQSEVTLTMGTAAATASYAAVDGGVVASKQQ
ncbi:hypothetical protein LSH36_207g06036 [Paralvinella palmiformis]|uniref:Uncharacterized protein n=1 Tax=Paralvinella palmiformis TaxID=53620 RepID=A0AAD9JP88_9ANNE|nr:hypothetical protein LSH36_207g06036 [Paralvinella palmiformis]